MLTFSIIKVLPLSYSKLLIVLGHDKSKALTVLHKGLGLQLCDGPMLMRSFLLCTAQIHSGKFFFFVSVLIFVLFLPVPEMTVLVNFSV